MPKYKIFIPAFVREIEAENEAEAREMFYEEYDDARQYPEFYEAMVEKL